MKIQDKAITKIVLFLAFLLSVKYVPLFIQVPFTLAFVPYREINSFNVRVQPVLKNNDLFKNRTYVGFYTDVEEQKVFDLERSVDDFYTLQYAIAPSVLVNDTDEKYVIGVFNNNLIKKNNLKMIKQFDKRTYLFERME